MIEHAQLTQALTLEQQAQSMAAEFEHVEELSFALSRRIYHLFIAFSAERGLNAGFYRWLVEHAGIKSTGNGKYYVTVGLALEKGITGSSTELYAAGLLLWNGEGAETTQGAVDDGSVKKRAEASQNAGYVKEKFPFEVSEKLAVQLERTMRLTGYTRDEALSVMLDAYSAIPDEAFRGYKA